MDCKAGLGMCGPDQRYVNHRSFRLVKSDFAGFAAHGSAQGVLITDLVDQDVQTTVSE